MQAYSTGALYWLCTAACSSQTNKIMPLMYSLSRQQRRLMERRFYGTLCFFKLATVPSMFLILQIPNTAELLLLTSCSCGPEKISVSFKGDLFVLQSLSLSLSVCTYVGSNGSSLKVKPWHLCDCFAFDRWRRVLATQITNSWEGRSLPPELPTCLALSWNYETDNLVTAMKLWSKYLTQHGGKN